MPRIKYLTALLGDRHAAKERPSGPLDLRTVRAVLHASQHSFR